MSFERVAVAEKKRIDIFLQVKWMTMILENSRLFHFENEMIFNSNRYFCIQKMMFSSFFCFAFHALSIWVLLDDSKCSSCITNKMTKIQLKSRLYLSF